FSSRRRHTRFSRDWSSDVCSSDLPLLANIALSVLDEHFASKWEALGPEWTRAKHRRAGRPVMKLIRYADDFVVLAAGQRADVERSEERRVGKECGPRGWDSWLRRR